MPLLVQSTSFNKSNKKQFSLISLKHISYCVSNYLTYSDTYTKYKANLDVYSSFIYIFSHRKENSLSLSLSLSLLIYQIKEFIWHYEENEKKNKVRCFISLHLMLLVNRYSKNLQTGQIKPIQSLSNLECKNCIWYHLDTPIAWTMNESAYRQISTIHNLGKYYFVFELICNIEELRYQHLKWYNM